MLHYYLATTWSKMLTNQTFFDLRYSNGSFTSPINQFLDIFIFQEKFMKIPKKRKIWVLLFICTDTIKSIEKILILTFLSFLKFASVKLAILEGIYALIILEYNIG